MRLGKVVVNYAKEFGAHIGRFRSSDIGYIATKSWKNGRSNRGGLTILLHRWGNPDTHIDNEDMPALQQVDETSYSCPQSVQV
jgi:hypothetical protein